jgi:hypothetical protein
MLQRARKTLPPPPLHFPLRKLALCLDCDSCFEFGVTTCPACGSETIAPLARFFQPAMRLSRMFRKEGGDGEPGSSTKRQLFIVGRDRAKLYDYVRRAFADNPTVQVVLDRRVGDRRRGAPPTAGRVPERRRADRRNRDISAQLRALGWAIVLLDIAGDEREHPRAGRSPHGVPHS